MNSFPRKSGVFVQKIAIAGSALLLLWTCAGCTPIDGQESAANSTSIVSTETTTNPDLKDVAPERLEFTKDLLNLYDESVTKIATPKEFETAFNKIKDFISRNQIIEYGKSGETGENLLIVKHKDGNPAVALINCADNVVNSFDGMIEEMNQYDSNFLEKMTENGLVAFMVNRFDENRGNSFTFNESGLVVFNLKPDFVDLINYKVLLDAVVTEVFGIKCLNLGGDYAKYSGYMKQQLAADFLEHLYEKTGNEYFKISAIGSYFIGKNYYGNYYSPVTLEDEKIQKLIKDVRNLIEPIGADSWNEIKAVTFTE